MKDQNKCSVCDQPLNAKDVEQQRCPNPECQYSWEDNDYK